MSLQQWAIAWGIPAAAVLDLQNHLGLHAATPEPDELTGKSESAAQVAVRLEAARLGVHLWRNNVGALVDERGVPVRFGLANDSKGMNKVIKSADLIGIRRCSVQDLFFAGVTHIGQFVSREMKEPGWEFKGGESDKGKREEAQRRWAVLVNSMGGDAKFATGPGTL